MDPRAQGVRKESGSGLTQSESLRNKFPADIHSNMEESLERETVPLLCGTAAYMLTVTASG